MKSSPLNGYIPEKDNQIVIKVYPDVTAGRFIVLELTKLGTDLNQSAHGCADLDSVYRTVDAIISCHNFSQ